MKYYIIFTMLLLSVELKAENIDYRKQIKDSLRDDEKSLQRMHNYKREACLNWKKKTRASKVKKGNNIVLLESLTLKIRPNSSDTIELLENSILIYKQRHLKKPDDEIVRIKYKVTPSNQQKSASISVKKLKSLLGEKKNPCAT